MIFYIVLISGSLYFLLILIFSIGWIRIKLFTRDNNNPDISCSVIVPARNEENNISDLLGDLSVQTYNKDNYEIIIIDDNSTDSTFNIAEDFCNKNPNFRLLGLNNRSGKKEAIIQGMQAAKGKLIITTDADCRMNIEWISTIAAFYCKYKPKMIVAPVIIGDDNTVFTQFQALELLSLTGSAAGAVGIHQPIMCNGANLAWERECFYEQEDALKKKIASGDDVFFMLTLKKKYRKEILFLKSVDAIVYTKAQSTVNQFINQRKRWISKSAGYKDLSVILSALTVYIISLLLLLLFVLMWYDPRFGKLFLILFIIKSLTDLIFLNMISSFFKKQKLILLFIPAQIIYFFYVSLTGIAGIFGGYTWKGRKLR